MQRIATSTAVDGGFVAGNPVSGQLATRFSPAWCNAVQEEIAGVIEAAGLTLDVNDNAQLVEAMDTIIREVVAEAQTIYLGPADFGLVLTGLDTTYYSPLNGRVYSTITDSSNYNWLMPLPVQPGKTITNVTVKGSAATTGVLTVILKSRVGTANLTTVTTLTLNSSSGGSASATLTKTLAAGEMLWFDCTIDNNGTTQDVGFSHIEVTFGG